MTQEQRDWLEKNNLDPTIYDIDAEGNVFENPVERMSKTRAALTSAAASTIPSLGGVAGAIPGAKAGAAIGAFGGPVGATVGGVIGALTGGFGVSYLTGKAQEAALERYAPEAIEQIARAQEEQPGASFVGGLAPTALTMRPSTQGLSGLLRPTVRGKTIREAITSPEFVAPASNVAVNVAQAGAGQALNVARGGEFSLPEFATEAAVGTLFNRPTRLGRKLGLPDLPEVPEAQKTDLERARLMAERPEEFVTPREERLGIGREREARQQYFEEGEPVTEKARANEYADWWKSKTKPTADLIKQAAESVKIKIPRERINELANDPDVVRVISDPTTLPEFVAKQSQDALQDAYENAMRERKLRERFLTAEERADIAKMEEYRTMAGEQRAAREEAARPGAELPEWMRPTPEDIAKAERIQKENIDTAKLEEGMAAQELLDEAKQRRDPQAIVAAREIYNDVASRLQRGDGEKLITQADIDAAAQIAARRGLKIELDTPFTGSGRVRGMYLSDKKTGDRIVRVNPLMATPDTAIHEIGHDIFRGVTNPSMRKSLLETAMDTPAFKSEMAARQAEVDQGLLSPQRAREIALEEGVIQAFGEQMPNINRSELRSWFQAFKASAKQLVTGRLSPDDAIAWLHYASTEAVPWKGVAVAKVDVAGEERMQRGSELFGLTNEDFAPSSDPKFLHATHLEQSNPTGLRVAVREPSGKVTIGKLGDLHMDLPTVTENSEFGFVDKTGNFLTREQASAQRANPDIRYQRGEERTRKFAGRVAASEEVPAEVRRTVAESPESRYEGQSVTAEAEAARTKTDRQLANDIIDPESNTRVISAMEQFNRQIASGDMEGAGTTAINIAKSGTTWGQLINQFKLLKSASREGVIQLVTKSLETQKRAPMTDKQKLMLGNAMDSYRIAQDALIVAKRNAAGAFESNNAAEIQKSLAEWNAADALRMKADVDLNETIARINPSSATDLFISLVQGSVMAPLSIVRNVMGNALAIPTRTLAGVTSSLIDLALTGNKNNAFGIRANTIDRIKAFIDSLPAAKKAILQGSNANPYELGTDIGNPLNFQRAWKNLYEAMSGNYSGNVARNIVEATVGAMPDIMLRLTQATDLPFRQSSRAAIISELGRNNGLSNAQIKLALKDPEAFLITPEARQKGRKGFTAQDIDTIENEAARAVFQQDNTATRMVAGINRFIKQEAGSSLYIPYRLISLFQKTPINVAAEALQFTPAGVLRDWKNMTPRERNLAVGRLVAGGMVMGAFSYLYDKGVITPNLDTPGETNKARELAKAGGVMPPGTINVSALRRILKGEDSAFRPGDIVKDLSAFGTAGALGIIVGSSKRIAERARIDEPDFMAIGKGSALSGINFIMEQQFLKGTSEFIKLLSQESEASLERFIKSLNVTAASPIAPATLGSIRRAQREYLPVTGGEGILKDTINDLNQRYAAIGLAIPGGKDPNAMPVRRNLWGEAVKQTPKGSNPWIDQFVDFWNRREIDADPLNASIYRVWRRTTDNSVIPSVPNPQITYKNRTFERMTPDQYDRYTQLVGYYRRMFAERAFMSGAYQQRGDEARIKFLSEAYDKGLTYAKKRFLMELAKTGQTLTPVAPRRGFEK